MSRAVLLRGALLCVLLVCIGALFWSTQREERNILKVVFFDVGQGDAIYIESPTGTELLIDGGRDTTILRRLSREMGFFDRTIAYVLATHLDADHVGGLVHVFDRYTVAGAIMSEERSDTELSDAFQNRVDEEDAEIVYPRQGDMIDLGGGVQLLVLFPDRSMASADGNSASIIARLTYGAHSFLLTGDAPASIEEYLVDTTEESFLKSTVLKVGHHGSKTSSDEDFVELVSPEYAVVQAGKDNRYGHPHAEVVDRFADRGVVIKNTADEGSITFLSNGKELWVR